MDVGSTFTKAVLVGEQGTILARAEHPTTLADVMVGIEACRAELAKAHEVPPLAHTLVCSSAGGGLRIAVVGTEELVSAEAGRRVALSSGGKVVHVAAGKLDDEATGGLYAAGPDVILLVGGTDGGDAEVLMHNAQSLGESDFARSFPVVVAGNAAARDQVVATLRAATYEVWEADNVLPRIGVMAPDSAREGIRQQFVAHVIGGKQLSASPEFAHLVKGATPDVVLTGVEVLAGLVGDTVVVDIGGATTDVHSVVKLDPEEAGLAREVVAVTPAGRTVEGDLGMRWSAAATLDAAVAAELWPDDDSRATATALRVNDPGFLPATTADQQFDADLAAAAATLAIRRHVGRSRVVLSPEGRVIERSGKDLREVEVLVGSGGVLRHTGADVAAQVFAHITGRSDHGWQQPESPRVVIDRDYVLAAVGLLASAGQLEVARKLARDLLESSG